MVLGRFRPGSGEPNIVVISISASNSARMMVVGFSVEFRVCVLAHCSGAHNTIGVLWTFSPSRMLGNPAGGTGFVS